MIILPYQWQTLPIKLRCVECRKYIYPGHLVWLEKSLPWFTPYCYCCGSHRQDEAVKQLQDHPHTVDPAAAGPEVGVKP